MGAALGTSVAGKFIEEIGLNYIWPLTFVLSISGIIGMYSIYINGLRKKSGLVEDEEQKKEIA
jgi:hypothetical protein